MSQHLINSTTLEAIGDEIRTMSGTTSAISPSTMKSKLAEANTEIDNQTDLLVQILDILPPAELWSLPALSNPASESHILKGYEVLDGSGELLQGTYVPEKQFNTVDWILTKSDDSTETKEVPVLDTEVWTFTLENGSTITKDIDIIHRVDFTNVTNLSISEGVVVCIYNANGNLIWEREPLPKKITITTAGYSGNSTGPGSYTEGMDVSYDAHILINGVEYGSGNATVTVMDGDVITLVTEGVGKGSEYARGGIYINGTLVAREYGANSENATATFNYTVRRPLNITMTRNYYYYTSSSRYLYYGTIQVTTL